MRWTVGAKMVGGFSLTLVVLVVIGVVSYRNTTRFIETAHRGEHTHEVLTTLERVFSLTKDVQRGARGYVITGDERYLEPYQAAIEKVDQELRSLRELTVDSSNQQRRLDTLEPLIEDRLAGAKMVIDVRKNTGLEIAVQEVKKGEGKKIMDTIQRVIDEMKNEEHRSLKKQSEEEERRARTTKSVIIGGTISSFVLVALASIFITRSVSRSLNEAVNTLSTTSAEIATTVEQHERTSAHQAALVNQTTATMDELNASFRQVAEAVETASERTHRALALSKEGVETERQMIAGMTDLKEKTGAVAEQILRLSEQIGQIGTITGLVGDIASRTTMLALNASVEAARAGEHGKGFGVVAAEIRKLADQSRNSVEKIGTLVRDIQNATNSTVMVTEEGTKMVEEEERLAHRTVEMFNGLSSSLNEVSQSAQQTSLTVNQQVMAVKQVVEAMGAINAGARETAAGITQTKIGIERLRETALQLKTMV